MRRRPSSLTTATAAIVSAVLVVAGCEARVYGTPPVDLDAPHLTVVAPQGSLAPRCLKPRPTSRTLRSTAWTPATKQATTDAAKSGADISAVVAGPQHRPDRLER